MKPSKGGGRLPSIPWFVTCAIGRPIPIMETSESPVSIPEYVGFLSVLDIEGVGFCGGYLLLNSSGRPVEFHCTLPVNPDRAQRILYGKSLEPFLFAQHIGKPLLEKSRLSPGAVFVEQASLLDLHTHSAMPVIHVWNEGLDNLVEQPPDTDSSSAESIAPESILEYRSGGSNGEATSSLVEMLDRRIDLLEPFERIREALHEAHSVRAA